MDYSQELIKILADLKGKDFYDENNLT